MRGNTNFVSANHTTSTTSATRMLTTSLFISRQAPLITLECKSYPSGVSIRQPWLVSLGPRTAGRPHGRCHPPPGRASHAPPAVLEACLGAGADSIGLVLVAPHFRQRGCAGRTARDAARMSKRAPHLSQRYSNKGIFITLDPQHRS